MGVTKINCYKALQSYTTKGFARPSWQVITETHIWIKMNQRNFDKPQTLENKGSKLFLSALKK